MLVESLPELIYHSFLYSWLSNGEFESQEVLNIIEILKLKKLLKSIKSHTIDALKQLETRSTGHITRTTKPNFIRVTNTLYIQFPTSYKFNIEQTASILAQTNSL